MPVATCDALTGLGIPPHVADLLGGNATAQNGKGTTQSGATVLLGKNVELDAASGNTAYVFPSTAEVMVPYFLTNQGSAAALVFVPSGHTLNVTANGDLSIATSTSAIMWQYKPKHWCYILSA
jgi:hypothetical protein